MMNKAVGQTVVEYAHNAVVRVVGGGAWGGCVGWAVLTSARHEPPHPALPDFLTADQEAS
jgi:hypothetical protein